MFIAPSYSNAAYATAVALLPHMSADELDAAWDAIYELEDRDISAKRLLADIGNEAAQRVCLKPRFV